MELSVLPRSQLESAPSDERCRAASGARLELFDVPVPADLRQFGETVRASALGDPANAAVVVLGGISANRFPAVRPDGSPGWWWGLAGEGSAIDPAKYCIIGLDFAADESGKAAPSTFDQARVLAAALDAIRIDQPLIIVGASYGGMVGLALAEIEPQRVARLVLIGAADVPHPAATAARELQRRVVALGIEADRGEEALAIARGMAMLTYRTPQEFAVRFDGGIAESLPAACSEPGGYLRARGQAFLSVMSPRRFLSLSASIDRHRVHPERIVAPTLLIGADSDQLVFPDQLRALHAALAGQKELHLLDSLFGHDMFLKEAERIGRIVAPFLGAA
ncbi:MAG TPA: alpha/beta fold hydrolase [Sphingomicrobium sp.]|jgi:homoserine O-acetyltransferase|nr:alpha/beta fold hydrolase [Sphingomicrobium sp.]